MKLIKVIGQNLIQKGKFKKYVIYAIGEILLVMIGISLAFQVDNWNETRVKKNSEINYYRNIKDQITDDKELIKSQLDFNNYYMIQFEYANQIIETNDYSRIDTLGSIIRNLTQYSDFDSRGNIYETMVNSGEIKILRNHGIVQGVRELEERYIYINRMESIHYDAMMKHTVTVINPIIKYNTGEIKRPELVYSYEFQNLIFVLIQVMKEKDQTYNDALNQIEIVTKRIDKELSR